MKIRCLFILGVLCTILAIALSVYGLTKTIPNDPVSALFLGALLAINVGTSAKYWKLWKLGGL